MSFTQVFKALEQVSRAANHANILEEAGDRNKWHIKVIEQDIHKIFFSCDKQDLVSSFSIVNFNINLVARLASMLDIA